MPPSALLFVWVLYLASLGYSFRITSRAENVRATPTLKGPGIFAIVPTTAGQIGVNPVSDLGPAYTYVGEVYGTDTRYITVIETQTKWIGVNTEYLTVDGTSTAQVVVATATVAAHGQNVGDLSIILAQGLAEALHNSAEAAVQACNAVLRIRRRQTEPFVNCALAYAHKDYQTGGSLSRLRAVTQELINAGVKISDEAASYLVTYLADLGGAEAVATIMYLMALAAAVQIAGVSTVGKFNQPAAGFAIKSKCTGNERRTSSTIICEFVECNGGDSGFCTTEAYRNCPCLLTMFNGPGPQAFDLGWLNYQQQWLQRVSMSPEQSSGPCITPGERFDSSLLLRILPLGASIVFGYGSTDKNGFREKLREMLTSNGAPVNYVGSIQSGSMLDNDVEAVGGFRIDQVAVQAEKALPWLPNVVLMHFGNNDGIQDYDVAHAHERLGALIDRVISAIPGVTVIVSTLFLCTDPVFEARIQVLNANIPGMVKTRVNQGKKVQLIDMHDDTFTTSDHFDSIHPNDAGYAKMANKFFGGIQQAYANCWITAPGFVAGLNDTVGTGTKNTICQKIPGNTVGPIQSQQGSGTDDGPYVHKGVVYGNINVGSTNISPAGVRWADINGDGLDDFVYIQDQPDGVAMLTIVLNDSLNFGGLSVKPYTSKAPGACKAEGMQFADSDGDGRDDLFCIGTDAKLYVWLNRQNGDIPGQPAWATSFMAFAPAGYTRSNMRIGDIDGDGRADYIAISANGEIRAWRHSGLGVAGTSYEDMGIMIHAGSIQGDPDGFRFVDINGDGRDDLLWVGTSGTVDTWINQRGYTLSHQPQWLPAGRTHSGGDAGITARNQVRFGKIRGEYKRNMAPYPNYQGIGEDYTYVPGGSAQIQLTVNNGNGGTRQKGDGSRYCDMRGTGSDDYVWISITGSLQLYGNSHNTPSWKDYGIIYTPPAALMADHFRKDIHLADMTGDGKCDFVIVNRNTRAVRIVRNDYSSTTDKFSWTDSGIWIDVDCGERYGIGLFDLSVRFADLDGDGKADYICIAPDGSAIGWLNSEYQTSAAVFDVGFWPIGQIKHDEGKNRANIRFYDVTGEGRADYIWLDRVTGAMSYWTNEGFQGVATASGDSAFRWTAQGKVGGGGSVRGECVNFADLNGDGRADYMDVYPDTNIAYVYYNLCPGNSNPPMEVLTPLPR